MGAMNHSCLDDLIIADFVDGMVEPAVRSLVVSHLAACERCRWVTAATARAVTAGTAQPVPAWRKGIGAVMLATAATLALIWSRPAAVPGTGPDLREPAITTTVPPRPVQPIGTVTAVDRLSWSAVPGALRYRVRLYDADGSVIWRGETTDTAIVPDPAAAPRPGATYFWRVEAQSEWERWAASRLTEFRIVP